MRSDNIAIIEDGKDPYISAILAIVGTIASYVILVNTSITQDFIIPIGISIIIGIIIFQARITAKNKLKVEKGNEFLEFLHTDKNKGRTIKGTLKWKDILEFTINPKEMYSDYFNFNSFNADNLWKTEILMKFEFKGDQYSMKIDGMNLNYGENIMKLFKWGYLIPAPNHNFKILVKNNKR